MADATPERSDTTGQSTGARRFPFVAICSWALFALAVPLIAQTLNLVDVLGFPLGYLMAAQGSLVALLAIGVLSVRRQSRAAATEGR